MGLSSRQRDTMKLSANLGFLFRELSFPDAIRAAAKAGFSAVECHWPYDVDPAVVRVALAEAGVPMLGINTAPGGKGEFGLAAVPGRESDARRLIDQAIDYATAVGAANVHVMAGNAEGALARRTFAENLRYADARIGDRPITMLIEPLNHRDGAGYFLRRLEDAVALIDLLGIARLKVMFDCYHMQVEGGDLLRRYEANAAYIGHIQFAGVPDRGEPDVGEVAYERLLPALVEAGYGGWLGAEYRPKAGTLAGLGWMKQFA
jgi:hydroxypyruvate isomerase